MLTCGWSADGPCSVGHQTGPLAGTGCDAGDVTDAAVVEASIVREGEGAVLSRDGGAVGGRLDTRRGAPSGSSAPLGRCLWLSLAKGR